MGAGDGWERDNNVSLLSLPSKAHHVPHRAGVLMPFRRYPGFWRQSTKTSHRAAVLFHRCVPSGQMITFTTVRDITLPFPSRGRGAEGRHTFTSEVGGGTNGRRCYGFITTEVAFAFCSHELGLHDRLKVSYCCSPLPTKKVVEGRGKCTNTPTDTNK